MSKNNKALADLEFTQTLKLLAQAYEEIAVVRMQRVRSSVFATREFLTQLSNVFYDVKINYEEERKKLVQNQNGKFSPSLVKHQLKTGNKNGKTISVFISSREKLYGDIIQKVFHLFQFQVFLLGTKKANSDIVIVGRYGKELMDNTKSTTPYLYFDLPDTNVSATELEPLLELLNKYEKINVFYGKMDTVMTQSATVSSVSGDAPLQAVNNQNLPKERYFFEPSLTKVMEYFESQVFYSLFYQTIHETELARLASRIKAMEESLSNIDRSETRLFKESRRLLKQSMNKKQLDMLSGIRLWRRR